MESIEGFDFEGFGESQFPPSELIELGLLDYNFAGIDFDSELGELIIGLAKEYSTLKTKVEDNGYIVVSDRVIYQGRNENETSKFIEYNPSQLKLNTIERLHDGIRGKLFNGRSYEDAVSETTTYLLETNEAINGPNRETKEAINELLFTAGHLYLFEEGRHYQDLIAPDANEY